MPSEKYLNQDYSLKLPERKESSDIFTMAKKMVCVDLQNTLRSNPWTEVSKVNPSANIYTYIWNINPSKRIRVYAENKREEIFLFEGTPVNRTMYDFSGRPMQTLGNRFLNSIDLDVDKIVKFKNCLECETFIQDNASIQFNRMAQTRKSIPYSNIFRIEQEEFFSKD